MSDKCNSCGVSVDRHEPLRCEYKDDSVHRMEIHLASAPLTGTSLAYIGRVVEEAQKAHPGKLIDVTIRHIGYWGKSQIEELIPLQKEINKSSFIPMAHENKREINHEQFAHAFAVNKFLEEADAKGYTLRPTGISFSWPNGGTVIKGNGVVQDKGTEMSVGSGEIRINGSVVQPETWVCENHPPGSEVEVKKGEACYCGNKEN